VILLAAKFILIVFFPRMARVIADGILYRCASVVKKLSLPSLNFSFFTKIDSP